MLTEKILGKALPELGPGTDLVNKGSSLLYQ
jgi:hypothetical protein